MRFIDLPKIFLVTINLVLTIFGLAVLVIGFTFKLVWDDVRVMFNDKVSDVNIQSVGDVAAVGALVFGTFIMMVSLLGCCGAGFDNKAMMAIYAFIVMVLFGSQLFVIGYTAHNISKVDDDLKESLEDSLKNYTETSSNKLSKAWSIIFNLGKCCGIEDDNPFKISPFIPDVTNRTKAGILATSDVPITCCSGFDYDDDVTVKAFQENRECLNNPKSDERYTVGCYEKVRDWIDGNNKVLIWVGSAILLIEMIAIVMAIWMGCKKTNFID